MVLICVPIAKAIAHRERALRLLIYQSYSEAYLSTAESILISTDCFLQPSPQLGGFLHEAIARCTMTIHKMEGRSGCMMMCSEMSTNLIT